jgi:hypothetical protein
MAAGCWLDHPISEIRKRRKLFIMSVKAGKSTMSASAGRRVWAPEEAVTKWPAPENMRVQSAGRQPNGPDWGLIDRAAQPPGGAASQAAFPVRSARQWQLTSTTRPTPRAARVRSNGNAENSDGQPAQRTRPQQHRALCPAAPSRQTGTRSPNLAAAGPAWRTGGSGLAIRRS